MMKKIQEILMYAFSLICITAWLSCKSSKFNDEGMYEITNSEPTNPKDIYRVYRIPEKYCDPIDSLKLIEFADKVFKNNIRNKFHQKRNVVGYTWTSEKTIQFDYIGITTYDGIKTIAFPLRNVKSHIFPTLATFEPQPVEWKHYR